MRCASTSAATCAAPRRPTGSRSGRSCRAPSPASCSVARWWSDWSPRSSPPSLSDPRADHLQHGESFVNLTNTPEQEELRASVRRFLADKSPSEAVRRSMESDEGHDPALWRQMAGQLGLQGIAVAEEFGGAGYGPVELGIVLEETGRALLPYPFFVTVSLAGQALIASEDLEAQARWLPGIADGSLTATVPLSEEQGGASL